MKWIMCFIMGTIFILTDLFFPNSLINFMPDCVGFFLLSMGIKKLEKETEEINYEMTKVIGMILTVLTISDLFNFVGFMSYDVAPSICFITVPDIFNYKEYITGIDRFNPLFMVLLFLKLFIVAFMGGFFFNLYKAFYQTNKKKDTPWLFPILCANYGFFILLQLMLVINFVFPGIKVVLVLIYILALIFLIISIFIYFVVSKFIKNKKYTQLIKNIKTF